MGGGIGMARVPVGGADGRPDSADRGGRGALLGARGKVGGDGGRLGGHRPVAVLETPCEPCPPCGAVLPASVRGAGIARCLVDARLVGGGDRSCGRAGGGELVCQGCRPCETLHKDANRS